MPKKEMKSMPAKAPAKTETPAPKSSYTLERGINKWGDIHLKKAMKESALALSGISPETPLVMTFEKGRIVVSVPKK